MVRTASSCYHSCCRIPNSLQLMSVVFWDVTYKEAIAIVESGKLQVSLPRFSIHQKGGTFKYDQLILWHIWLSCSFRLCVQQMTRFYWRWHPNSLVLVFHSHFRTTLYLKSASTHKWFEMNRIAFHCSIVYHIIFLI